MHSNTKKSVTTRLNRIEGQVRGVARMIDDDRYCMDVLTQLQAVRAALQKVEEEILKDHVRHCVAQALVAGDEAHRRRKVDELVSVLERLTP